MSTLSRRLFLGVGVLVAGAAGAGAGIVTTHAEQSGPAARPSPPAPRPDRPDVVAAVRRELDLIDRLQQAAQLDPSTAGRVRILVADHRAHAAALQSLLAHPVAAATPATVVKARVGDLVAWEKTAAAQAAKASAGAAGLDSAGAGSSGSAADGTLVALLASIAACESSHAAWLS